jgi:hypothetical protein
MEKKVQVAVPKDGRRHHFSMGVFVPETGIINVEMPLGVEFGDEFELSYAVNHQPQPCQVISVPAPYGMKPGMTFRHRVPNGKTVLVSCPPNVSENCSLLVPWSDATNAHYIVQACVAPEKPKEEPRHPPANMASRIKKAGGFAKDDIELARALSLTTLQNPGDEEDLLKKALQASLEENVPKHLVPHRIETAQMPTTTTIRNTAVTGTPPVAGDDENEDALLAMAMKQSLEEATRAASAALSIQAEDDEDDAIARIMELSRREAEEKAARMHGLYKETSSSSQAVEQNAYPRKPGQMQQNGFRDPKPVS